MNNKQIELFYRAILRKEISVSSDLKLRMDWESISIKTIGNQFMFKKEDLLEFAEVCLKHKNSLKDV